MMLASGYRRRQANKYVSMDWILALVGAPRLDNGKGVRLPSILVWNRPEQTEKGG